MEALRLDGAPAAPDGTTAAAIRIDGELTEAAWQQAPVVTGFLQRDPNDGAPATYQTEARIAYDASFLYVAVTAMDPEPAKIVGHRTRRDERSPSDWIRVIIDSFHDKRSAFEFAVNPAGVKQDRYWFNDGNSDDGWDAVWDVSVARRPDGWRAEFRIPFSQLRFQPTDSATFGLAFVRADRPSERDVDLAAAVEERQRLRLVVRRPHRPAPRSLAEAAGDGALRRGRRDAAAGRGRATRLMPGDRSRSQSSAST